MYVHRGTCIHVFMRLYMRSTTPTAAQLLSSFGAHNSFRDGKCKYWRKHWKRLLCTSANVSVSVSARSISFVYAGVGDRLQCADCIPLRQQLLTLTSCDSQAGAKSCARI